MKLILKTIFINLCLISILFAQPSAPQNLSAQSVQYNFEGNLQILVRLNWDKVTDSNGDAAPVYNIYRKDGAINDAGDFTLLNSVLWNNSITDKTVEMGKTYSYYVTAQNDLESEASDKVEIVVSESSPINETASISGNVTDELTNNTLKGVYVTLVSTEQLVSAKIVITDNDGNYFFDAIPGNYKLYFKPMMNYSPEYYNNASHIWEADTVELVANDTLKEINAQLTPLQPMKYHNLSGHVVDTLGNPVDAFIEIIRSGLRNHPVSHSRVRTDSEGNFTAEVKEGAEVILYAHPVDNNLLGEFFENSYSMEKARKIVVNDNVDSINFILDSKTVGNSSISGSVLNSKNEVVPAMIVAIKLGTERFQKDGSARAFVDDEGNYSFTNLSNGDYIIFSLPEEGYLPTFYKSDGSTTVRWQDADILTLEGNTELVDINFLLSVVPEIPENGFANISGKILDDKDNLVASAYVCIYDQSNQIVSYAFTDQNGNYTADGLAPGVYKVACDNYTFSPEEMSNVYVGLNEPTTVNFTLSADVAVGIEENKIVANYELKQNYPNPFNPTTKITFSILNKSNVNLTIYNILGQEIIILVNKEMNPGEYNYQFDASSLPSGIYVYKLSTDNFTQTRKMVLLK